MDGEEFVWLYGLIVSMIENLPPKKKKKTLQAYGLIIDV